LPAQVLGCADSSPLAQRFSMRNGGIDVEHYFDNNASLVEGGWCIKHQCHCQPSVHRPQFTTAGLPCQPFTKQRTQNDCKPRSGAPSDHPDFDAVVEFVSYLEQRCPESFLVEEVTEWDTNMPDAATTYMQDVAVRCAKLGYAVRAMVLDHNMWVQQVPRKRIGWKQT
jgi:hypothetical protein